MQLQLQLQLTGVQRRFAAFEALVGGGSDSEQHPDGAALLPRLWRLPWENQHTEVFCGFWRSTCPLPLLAFPVTPALRLRRRSP